MLKKSLFYVLGFVMLAATFVACRYDTGTVSGTVRFSGLPCQPGQPDFNVPPCTGPYPNFKLEIYSTLKPETVATTVMTDRNGHYSIELPVGEYIIYTQKGIQPENKIENRFTIEKDKTTSLELSISTGIL